MANVPGPGGARATLDVSVPTVIKSAPGVVVRVVVVTAPTVAGGVYDSEVTSNLSALNQIAVIPIGSTQIMELDWPCESGITVNPGTGGVLSVSYT